MESKFFKKMEDYRIISRFYENQESFSVEEIYQAFKERLIDELKVELPNTGFTELIDGGGK